ncbi:MAG: hypothetical protein H0X66_06415 [Verrucomicrobia bacterium]|nr:hypothetical protein [Verrucomicrobiota bacterium]
MIWLLQFTAVCLLAWGAGSFLGKRFPVSPRTNSFLLIAVVLFLLVAWFGFSWWARGYGDTDKAGWQWAEAWAHTGKWYALLGGALFGIRFAAAGETKRPRGLTLACALLIGVVAWRTMPMYFLLGEKQRDRDGYLRQSSRLECTCGGVALANYLEQFCNRTVSEREITKASRTTWEGSTAANLLYAAQSYGLTNAAVRQLTWDELRELRQPVIVSISTLPQMLHATLLIELNETEAVFIDPAYGRWVITPQYLRHILRGKTILLQ